MTEESEQAPQQTNRNWSTDKLLLPDADGHLQHRVPLWRQAQAVSVNPYPLDQSCLPEILNHRLRVVDGFNFSQPLHRSTGQPPLVNDSQRGQNLFSWGVIHHVHNENALSYNNYRWSASIACCSEVA